MYATCLKKGRSSAVEQGGFREHTRWPIVEWQDEVDSTERNAADVKASGYSKSEKGFNSFFCWKF